MPQAAIFGQTVLALPKNARADRAMAPKLRTMTHRPARLRPSRSDKVWSHPAIPFRPESPGRRILSPVPETTDPLGFPRLRILSGSPGRRLHARHRAPTDAIRALDVIAIIPTAVSISSRPAFPSASPAITACYSQPCGRPLMPSRFASSPVVAQVPPALRPSSLRRSPRAFPFALRVPAQEP